MLIWKLFGYTMILMDIKTGVVMNRLFGPLILILTTAFFSACVTINISFPPAAAEKAADKIIDEVWQLKEGEKQPASKSVQPQ